MPVKLILMYCVILLGLAFMALPDNTEAIDFFLFNDVRLTFQTYVYFIFEHLGIIILSYIIAVDTRQYKKEVYIFFWLQVLGFLDYLLTYNSTWFHIGMIPISMNVITVAIFGMAIINRDGRL